MRAKHTASAASPTGGTGRLPQAPPALDLTAGVADVAAQLVDIPSESGEEEPLADAVQAALRRTPHLTVERTGNSVVARTSLGRSERAVLAGHLDTVPAAGNLPSRLAGGRLHGLGACDMKGGVAVALRLAATVTAPVRDLTYVFYECEEIAGERNGLAAIAARRPGLLDEADVAILLEPSDGRVELGCQGIVTAEVAFRGERAHTARAWQGRNAVHRAAGLLRRLEEYDERVARHDTDVRVDGLVYREGLSAVAVRAGVADNVVPDECVITLNHRFAPDRSPDEAVLRLRRYLDGHGHSHIHELRVTDVAAPAPPGLHLPAVAALTAALGGEPRAKLGWTDVARFASLGVPALNYGPGDPLLAHTAGEYVPVRQLTECEGRLRRWLTG